ncbi:YbaY family lipoprotein [Aerosakkonemataceae cyanobacterium BLCC-F154]|uniref:YbaY family lipoprotein n=1 Tax=Floridaenema fluviatile BLCC-F154 TaxID=3153640 RepID=A0ABV4YDC5_9CYAN
MKSIGSVLAIALTTTALVGSTTAIAQTPTTTGQFSSVSGNVTYRERIALPPDALLIVQLQDTSKQDAPAVVIGQQIIPTQGRQVPFPFEIVYNRNTINPSHTYTVQAKIIVDNRLRFINTNSYPVITRGNPNKVDILLNSVGTSPRPKSVFSRFEPLNN